MTDAYEIQTLIVGDDAFDRRWQTIEWLGDDEGWVGRPVKVLSDWFDHVDPEPGTYRCVDCETRERAEAGWYGREVMAS